MTREHAGLDTLDWNRLRSGGRRALNPENQPLFDQFYALNREPADHEDLEFDLPHPRIKTVVLDEASVLISILRYAKKLEADREQRLNAIARYVESLENFDDAAFLRQVADREQSLEELLLYRMLRRLNERGKNE